jgi:hypothetical protein
MFYSRSQVVKFVVLMMGRTGSSYLITALDSHPMIRARGERLVQLKNAGRSQAQLTKARRMLTPWPICTYRALGYKTKLIDILDLEGFASLLRQNDARIISLRRHNAIKWTISILNHIRLLTRTGKHNLGSEKDRPGPIQVDLDEFNKYLEYYRQRYALIDTFINTLDLPVLHLFYEDFLSAEEATFNEVFSYLDVPPRPVRPETVKITSDDLRQAVINFEQLRAAYLGTEYEAMFDEVILSPA